MESQQKKQPEAQQFMKLREGELVQLLAKSGNEADSPRAFKMLAYTGEVVQRWFGRLVFDLKGIKFSPDATPILKNHDYEQIVGMSSKVSVDAKGLQIEGFISRKTECAREVADLSDEGFKWQASVGMEILSVERLEADATADVNGKQITGPAYVVRQSKLRESSFVPVGADGETSGEVLSFLDERSSHMSDKNQEQKPQTDVLAAERKRVAELKAAYPKDAEFALLAIEKGWLLVEAKAEYSDVLQKRNEKLEADLEAAKKAQPGKTPEKLGPDPIGAGGSKEGGEGSKTFLQLSDEYRAANKCSVQEAMSQTARLHPSAHEKYVLECRGMKPREVERAASK